MRLGIRLLAMFLTMAATDASASSVPMSQAPFAVVELFTSEGCSSCPPADKLLRDLDRIARADDARVFVLSYHVDYWNDHGWRDPYSSARYSRRQQRYARIAGSNRVYTPQMVVNGGAPFVGSRRQRAAREVDNALGRSADVGTGVRASYEPTTRKVRVLWTLEVVPKGAQLILALAEFGLRNRVLRGENRGRTLMHEGVVRAFAAVDATSRGEVVLTAPEGTKRDNATVVLLLQDRASMKVLGAARSQL